MKLVASTLAALTLACTAVAVAQPRLQTQPQIHTPAQTPDSQVPWQKQKNSEGDQPTLEFSASEPHRLNCELMSDTYEQKQTVAPAANAPERTCPAVTGNDPPRPPQTTVIWGNQQPRFQGAIDNIQTKYNMFLPDGTPTRATANVDVTQATKLGSKQSPPPDTQDDDQSDDDHHDQ